MGLSKQDVIDLTLAWRNTTVAALKAVHAAGGWVWQMFTENGVHKFLPNETASSEVKQEEELEEEELLS